MQQSYLFSNKENDYVGDRPSYRSKINYQQQRQHYRERSKSPLAETSQRYNLKENNHNLKVLSTSKKRDVTYKYAQEPSSIQTFGNRYEQRQSIFNINNHKQSVLDLSKIKPISLENNKYQQHVTNKQVDKEPLLQKTNDYRTYSRSAHRQNSKHLNFVAKVDNLEKINHQISSLLSFVNENKSCKKEKENQSNDLSISQKPRYGIISQNSKSYQRRLNDLQKPKQPNISVFDDESYNKRLTPTKRQNNGSYFKKNELNQQLNENQNRSRTPKSTIKMDLSPRNVQRQKRIENNPVLSPLKTIKSQQFAHLMTPSQSLQKLSKITTGNNPDLQFYYESLKKRDQQIQKFQKSHHNAEFQRKRQHSQNKYLITYSNFINNREENKQKSTEKRNHRENHQEINFNFTQQKNNNFVTENQIQLYKDKSSTKKHENQRVSSTKRIENLRAQINKSENQHLLENKQKYFPKNKQQRTLSVNNKIRQKKDTQNDEQNHRQLRSSKFKIEPDFHAKIQDQMAKIQNQMKECQNQKNFFRGKYSNLLSTREKEKSPLNQKNHGVEMRQNSFIQQKQKKYDNDNERLFDSSSKKVNKVIGNQRKINDDEFHQDLRKRIVSQNQPYGINEDYQSKENLPRRKNVFQLSCGTNQTTFINTYSKNVDMKRGYEADMSSNDYSLKSPEVRTPTNSKNVKKFEITLQKVQVTKPETTKLGTLLAEKIELDMKLREQRQKFWRIKNVNKWEDLRQHLANRYGMSKSSKQLQDLLSISPEQHNPFSPTHLSNNAYKNFNKTLELQRDGSTEQDILLLASLLAESMNYFDSQLLHNFSEEKLKKQHFTFHQLDLSSKGYLSLEDLICFINLHSGKFYRNRDAIFLVKSMMIFYNNQTKQNSPKNGIQSYSSQKGGNAYKISYNFLWDIFTYKK